MPVGERWMEVALNLEHLVWRCLGIQALPATTQRLTAKWQPVLWPLLPPSHSEGLQGEGLRCPEVFVSGQCRCSVLTPQNHPSPSENLDSLDY